MSITLRKVSRAWRGLFRGLLPLLAFSLSGATVQADNVRMVVTAAFVSEQGLPIYDELADYLSSKTGHDVRTVSGISYHEADMMLSRGLIQVGFICGLPYVQGKLKGDYELLATPSMQLQAGVYPDVPGYQDVPGKYYSYTIVRKDSPLKSWQDLRGRHYTYNDQGSNSGYNMPRYKLVQLGARSWEDWFGKITVSGSHEESVRLVARGAVDASSVDSLVLDYERSRGDPDALNVRVIEALFPGGAGAPPVVVGARTPPALVAELRQVLLSMHQDPQGRAMLDKALIERFLPPDDHNFDDIRRMEAAARDAGFRDHIP
jgi:phosphonate transport system substrate-binding protein